MAKDLRNLTVLRTEIATSEVCLIEATILSSCGDPECEGQMEKKEVFEVDDMTVIVLDCSKCGYSGRIELNLE
jgi:hypothetical protein